MKNLSVAKPSVKKRINQNGAVLVEGVVALVLIIIGTVLGTLLLVNSGLSIYYKEKLGFVANQASQFAFQLPADKDPRPQTTVFVNELIEKIGLPAEKTTVTTDNTVQIAGVRGAKVIISAELKLIGKGDVLPLTIPLTETAIAIASNYIISGPPATSAAVDTAAVAKALGITGTAMLVRSFNPGGNPTSRTIVVPMIGAENSFGPPFGTPLPGVGAKPAPPQELGKDFVLVPLAPVQ